MSVIALDVGTSRVKAVRFDDAWQAVDTASENTVVHKTRAGHSEQNPLEVHAAACRVIAQVAERCPDEVRLLAVTAQGDGCWLVDAEGKPIRRALLWNDDRATEFIEEWERDGTLADAFRVTGCDGSPGLAHAQLRWLHKHEPATLERAATLLSCGSWIYFRLTGRRVLEVSDAANPFLDARTRRYDPALLTRYGLHEYARLLPEVVAEADRIGELGHDAAVAVGLPAGTPVSLAPYDVAATASGCGILDEGRAFAVLGTTLCVGVVTGDPNLERPRSGMTLPGPRPDQWLICHATMIGTEVLDWTARLLGVPDTASLLKLAAEARPGEQPLLLPYLSPAGERSPFRNASIRGSLLNIDINHTRADIARAAADGLTLAVRDCLTAAGPAESVVLCGGGARSDLWRQAICDAIGRPVTAPDTEELTARGAALLGAADLGLFDSLADAVDAAVRPGAEHHPDPVQTTRFDEAYDRFLQARAATGN